MQLLDDKGTVLKNENVANAKISIVPRSRVKSIYTKTIDPQIVNSQTQSVNGTFYFQDFMIN